jgi:hypothetical protein
MGFRRKMRAAYVGLLLIGGIAAAAPAGGPLLTALTHIELGQWQFKEAGAAVTARSLCVSDPTTLLQLGHPGVACSRFVIADLPGAATVHYTCPGAGHGRTTVSVETPRLIHLQTQGIANGAPFDFDYEARRIGGCSLSATAPH